MNERRSSDGPYRPELAVAMRLAGQVDAATRFLDLSDKSMPAVLVMTPSAIERQIKVVGDRAARAAKNPPMRDYSETWSYELSSNVRALQGESDSILTAVKVLEDAKMVTFGYKRTTVDPRSDGVASDVRNAIDEGIKRMECDFPESSNPFGEPHSHSAAGFKILERAREQLTLENYPATTFRGSPKKFAERFVQPTIDLITKEARSQMSEVDRQLTAAIDDQRSFNDWVTAKRGIEEVVTLQLAEVQVRDAWRTEFAGKIMDDDLGPVQDSDCMTNKQLDAYVDSIVAPAREQFLEGQGVSVGKSDLGGHGLP